MATATRGAVRRAAQQAAYWETQAATVDGMLGGYGALSPADVAGSLAFLDLPTVQPLPLRRGGRVLDCGAGIGRVTKQLLLPSGYASADLLDISPDFLAAAETYIAAAPGQLGERYCSSLAAFDFDVASGRRWRCIWAQWCVIYLYDDVDFVDFFARAAQALDGPDACIVLKENTLARQSEPEVDTRDCSITRCMSHMLRLFKEAGLDVVQCTRQTKFPKDLYPVYMFALKPHAQVEATSQVADKVEAASTVPPASSTGTTAS